MDKKVCVLFLPNHEVVTRINIQTIFKTWQLHSKRQPNFFKQTKKEQDYENLEATNSSDS